MRGRNRISTFQVRPSVVDDFIRNFLIKVGLTRTLDSFNTEWYELQAKGRLGEEYTTKVPDIYLRNEELDEQVRADVGSGAIGADAQAPEGSSRSFHTE